MIKGIDRAREIMWKRRPPEKWSWNRSIYLITWIEICFSWGHGQGRLIRGGIMCNRRIYGTVIYLRDNRLFFNNKIINNHWNYGEIVEMIGITLRPRAPRGRAPRFLGHCKASIGRGSLGHWKCRLMPGRAPRTSPRHCDTRPTRGLTVQQ